MTAPRLTLHIDDVPYDLRPLAGGGYSLRKHGFDPGGEEPYRVTPPAEAPGRPDCTCPDFFYRRKGKPELGPCKHGEALARLGLVREIVSGQLSVVGEEAEGLGLHR